jgi:hypothetical protein
MTTDRELLELAAKAAELDAIFSVYGWCEITDGAFLDGNEPPTVWNPFADDGDALRLAVDLGLELYHSISSDRWNVFVGYPKQQRIVYVIEEYGDDQHAATRRAIVRAAAEIGKGMK